MKLFTFGLTLLICLYGVSRTAILSRNNKTPNSMSARMTRGCTSLPSLTCYFQPTSGNNVRGIVTFEPELTRVSRYYRLCFVRIKAEIRNLSPGLHGFHIHTYGDIRVSDGSAAEDHFANPSGTSTLHGLPKDRIRHWGDFGNLEADKEGVARYSRLDRVITIPGIPGRGTTIHALLDQGSSEQSTGASGARQAQCVIGFANLEI